MDGLPFAILRYGMRHRMLTDTSPVQDKLAGIFGLARYAPRR